MNTSLKTVILRATSSVSRKKPHIAPLRAFPGNSSQLFAPNRTIPLVLQSFPTPLLSPFVLHPSPVPRPFAKSAEKPPLALRHFKKSPRISTSSLYQLTIPPRHLVTPVSVFIRAILGQKPVPCAHGYAAPSPSAAHSHPPLLRASVPLCLCGTVVVLVAFICVHPRPSAVHSRRPSPRTAIQSLVRTSNSAPISR
jgi:hypothetical protein